jgi:hypothetical protein
VFWSAIMSGVRGALAPIGSADIGRFTRAFAAGDMGDSIGTSGTLDAFRSARRGWPSLARSRGGAPSAVFLSTTFERECQVANGEVIADLCDDVVDDYFEMSCLAPTARLRARHE